MENRTAAIVHLRGVNIAQGENLLLRDVNFDLQAGEFYYLVGRVGSGKSSFISTLTGQLPLHAGEGEVCGYDLTRLRASDIPYLRRNIGVVFQDFKLLSDRNIERNLYFVLRATGWKDKQAIKERIEQVLALVELQHKAYKMPNQISGGEQQRVAIARALLNDPSTSDGIMQILRSLVERKKAVIMATHNYRLVRRFPARVYRCAEGAMKEISTEELVALRDELNL